MELIKYIILGLVQGLTEFLPISSSGHLVLAQDLFGWSEQTDISFEIFVHLGSLCAVFIYFRNDILSLIKSLVFFRDSQYLNERKLCLWICIATLVTGVIGFGFKSVIEGLFAYPLLVAIMLSVTGGIIYLSDKIKHSSVPLNAKKSVFIGLGQAVAIIPGLSRSGTTITCGLLAGLDRKTAASFSFLLSIPAILGANLSELKSFTSLDSTQIYFYLAGFVSAFISGYLVISWLLKLIVRAKLRYFSFYCWAVSLFCIVFIYLRDFR